MKLLSVDASPYVRKVRILIIELGLQDTVKLEAPGTVTPVTSNDLLNNVNPLGMIPALELDDGQSLFDSPVICEYLNHIANGTFIPADASHRLEVLGLQALADGILDVSVALRYETFLRPETLRWQEWIDQQHAKVERALDALEQRCESFELPPLLGEIAVACALGYRDFRNPEIDWRSSRPLLTAWYDEMMKRESLLSTMPK